MKKLFALLSFCTLVLTTSCTEEKLTEKSPYLGQIAGVWTLESIEGNESGDGFGDIHSMNGTTTFSYSHDIEIEVEFTGNQYSLSNSDNDPEYINEGFFKIADDNIYLSEVKGELSQNDEFLTINQVDNTTLVAKHYILLEFDGETLPLFLSKLTFSKK